MRASDRFEASIRMLAVVVMLVVVPIAGAAGTAGYTAAAARISADNAAKVLVGATITGEPKRVVVMSERAELAEGYTEAPVQWNRNGRSGTATVEVPSAAARGDEIQVWVAPDGSPTDPPEDSSVAAGVGAEVGAAVLVAAWGSALALVLVTARVLDGRRRARWGRDWRQVAQRIGKDRQ